MASNEKFNAVGTNIAEKVTVIWNIANHLFGYFKPHEYGLVILPMTVVKRFHDCLLPTHQAVLETFEKVKKLARYLRPGLCEYPRRNAGSVPALLQGNLAGAGN